MIVAVSVILTVVVLWACVAVRVEHMRVTMPLALMLAGMFVGWQSSVPILESLGEPQLERVVEVVLAILLFLDATEVGEGEKGTGRVILRLVLIGVPLSLVFGTVVAAFSFPTIPLGVCLVLACIVAPTDMAPASRIVKDPRLPGRVRHILNVESGYNDGIVAPVFLFAVALLASVDDETHDPIEALTDLLPAGGWALLIGVVVGGAAAWAARFALRRGWTDARSLSFASLAVPLLAYTITLGVGGNGFVTAFVAGLAHRAVTGPEGHESLRLAEDVATFASTALWFVFGQLLLLILVAGFDWRALVFAFLAVTVVRMVPVLLSLLGSSLPWRERWLLSWLGPRGIASIVFALLAIHDLQGRQTLLVLQVLVLTVALSALLHGVSVTFIAARTGRATNAAADATADGEVTTPSEETRP